MKKWNLSTIMHTAWKIFRKGASSFSEALRTAWATVKGNTAAAQTAKKAANVTEEAHTWAGWHWFGMEVKHGSKALYQVREFDPCKGKTVIKSYFGLSQVQPMAE